MAKYKIIKKSTKKEQEEKVDYEYLIEAAKLLGFKSVDDMKVYIDRHGAI